MSEQLSMFDYWTPEDEAQFNDHVGKTPLEMVREYHQTASLTIGADAHDPSHEDTHEFRLNLIREEFQEAHESVWTDGFIAAEFIDSENLIKELADIVYVVYGYAVTFGWDLDEAVRRVHENNMGRMYQPDGTIKRRDDGKVLKNKDYPKVELGDLV